MVTDMRVRDIMSTNILTVEPSTTVGEVARLMAETGHSGIPVVDGERLVGIVTEADIISHEMDVELPAYGTFLDAIFRLPWDESDDDLRRVLAIDASQLMTTDVKTIRADAAVHDLASLMYKRHVNPVPVVDTDGRVVGIVSRTDVIRLVAAAESSDSGEVSE